jgi:hypothetical protein
MYVAANADFSDLRRAAKAWERGETPRAESVVAADLGLREIYGMNSVGYATLVLLYGAVGATVTFLEQGVKTMARESRVHVRAGQGRTSAGPAA